MSDLANSTVIVYRDGNEQFYNTVRMTIGSNQMNHSSMRTSDRDNQYPFSISSDYVEVPIRSLFIDEKTARDFEYQLDRHDMSSPSVSIVQCYTTYGLVRFRLRRGYRLIRRQPGDVIYEAFRILPPGDYMRQYGMASEFDRGILPIIPMSNNSGKSVGVPTPPPKKTTKELDEKHFKVETIKLKQDD